MQGNEEMQAAQEQLEQPKKVVNVWKEIFSWVVSIALAFVVAFLINTYIGRMVQVDGPSMQPTLYTGERVLVGRVPYYFRAPVAGEIVVVHFPGEKEFFVKRVIGVAGDELEMRDGVLYRNGLPCDEPYLREEIKRPFGPYVVPEDTVFVAGDNRNDSKDSRIVGPIVLEDVVGKAYCILWPLNKMKNLTT